MTSPASTTNAWQDYELLDSGNGEKLERFGAVTLIRPEPQATWQPTLPRAEWDAAGARFVLTSAQQGRWRYRQFLPMRWPMCYRQLRFFVQANESRQVGVFPENAAQWDWLAAQIDTAGRPLHLLNLFGYTGLATLAAAQAGAHVTHVDASRKAVSWARDNQALSGLHDHPIRWIVEDALTYLRREDRRGMRYDGLILDPPAFGRGPRGEVWTFQDYLDTLVDACRAVLSRRPQCIVATLYAKTVAPEVLVAGMERLVDGLGGHTDSDDLILTDRGGRTLHPARAMRWHAAPP